MLVGFRTYDKKTKDANGEVVVSKPQYIYDVFCKGIRTDKVTGLCTDESKVIGVIEDEPVLEKMQYGMAVEFYGETSEFRGKDGKTQTSIRYSGIEALELPKGGKA